MFPRLSCFLTFAEAQLLGGTDGVTKTERGDKVGFSAFSFASILPEKAEVPLHFPFTLDIYSFYGPNSP